MGGGLALKRLTQKTTVVMNHKYKIILMGEYTFLLQWWDHTKSSKTTANWTLADIILLPRWNVFILSHPKFLSSMHSDTNPVCWPKPYFFFPPLHKKWMLGFPPSRSKKDKHTSRTKLIWNTAQLQPQKRSLKYTNKSCDSSDAQPLLFLSVM